MRALTGCELPIIMVTSRAKRGVSTHGEHDLIVMAGLVPAVHASISTSEGVDARRKAGHDAARKGQTKKSALGDQQVRFPSATQSAAHGGGIVSNFVIEFRLLVHDCCERANNCLRGTSS